MPKQAGSYAFDFQLNVPLTHADGDLDGPVCIDASLKVVSRQNDQPQGDDGTDGKPESGKDDTAKPDSVDKQSETGKGVTGDAAQSSNRKLPETGIGGTPVVVGLVLLLLTGCLLAVFGLWIQGKRD